VAVGVPTHLSKGERGSLGWGDSPSREVPEGGLSTSFPKTADTYKKGSPKEGKRGPNLEAVRAKRTVIKKRCPTPVLEGALTAFREGVFGEERVREYPRRKNPVPW